MEKLIIVVSPEILVGVIIGLFAAISFDLIIGLYHARQYRYTGSNRFATKHEAIMKANVYKVVAGVVLVELLVRMSGNTEVGNLFMIHLGFALPFILSLLALAFWLNGFRFPGFHKVLGYGCLISFLGVLSTGIPLLFMLSRH